MIPSVDAICSKYYKDIQDILQLFDDKTFKIVSGADIVTSFPMGDFAFPTDGHMCISIKNLKVANERVLFDNGILSVTSPLSDLVTGDAYARGILLRIAYPDKDENDDKIHINDKNVELWIEDALTLEWKMLPLYNFFAMFTNPKSNKQEQLINRIKIINPSSTFDVSVGGLIVFGIAEEK